MGLKDEIISIVSKADEERDNQKNAAQQAMETIKRKDREDATAALEHLLSDESIKKIIKTHAAKGGKRVAMISAKNGMTALYDSPAIPSSRQTILDITFAAKPMEAAQAFKDEFIQSRVRELAKEGLKFESRFDMQEQVLVIAIDYSKAVS
ncbi:hypothetical protein [Rhizobium sp. SG741]|uniref:hypothetical protein n=1 Tax=Rhizobium sp. SG741 TaxID=2587114 RepID=UPI0014484CE7|nr:hypothetical protein [Rhizobium sp. SG741]NKJ03461.1 hypothetical protein [Rhizobium sp. SG741]